MQDGVDDLADRLVEEDPVATTMPGASERRFEDDAVDLALGRARDVGGLDDDAVNDAMRGQRPSGDPERGAVADERARIDLVARRAAPRA